MQPCFHPESLARFYTDKKISELLVGLIKGVRANRIIDLGSGNGSLAVAARRRWRNAEIITVDIDVNGAPERPMSFRALGMPHRHVRADALDMRLPSRLVSEGRLFDVAVCNPPYLSPTWRKGFEHILEEAGLLPAYPVMSNAGADILFIAQNLRLVREGGQLGLIVPDGIIAGRRMSELRELLMSCHQIEEVVQLPRNAFRKTEAQTYILTLRKGHPTTDSICIRSLSSDGLLSPRIHISKLEAAERLDYAYHQSKRKSFSSRQRITLESIGAEVVRGRLNSREARNAPFPVFHISDFPDSPALNYRIPKHLRIGPRHEAREGNIIAGPGDILVARVGRNISSKVCLIVEGRVVITDWIFRLSVPAKWRKYVIGALSTSAHALSGWSRGVGATHLSKTNLLQLPL